MLQKDRLNWKKNLINDDTDKGAVSIGDICRNTYNNFKNIYIYFVSKDHSLVVQDNAKRKNMGQGI